VGKPAQMNLLADLLFFLAVAGLAYAALLAFLRLPVFPLREMVVTAPLRQVSAAQLEYAALSSLSGNFFTVNPEAVRAALEKLPWVRQAGVRRRWPDSIELEIEEHVAAARWVVQSAAGAEAETQLVNQQGEVFVAAGDEALPLLGGPPDSAAEVLQRYREFTALLASAGRTLRGLTLTPRLAWQAQLDDGMVLDMGRNQPKSPVSDRLARFAGVYREAMERLHAPASRADLRYPNGFALRTEIKGQR